MEVIYMHTHRFPLFKRVCAVLSWCLAGAAVCIASTVAAAATACAVREPALVWVSGDFSIPELAYCAMTDARTIEMGFSKPVSVNAVLCGADGSNAESIQAHTAETPSAQTYVARMQTSASAAAGEPYLLHGEAEDTNGNTLSFSVPVTGYNGRVPLLVLSEIRTAYTKGKAEFVELYAVTSGNLAGITLFSAYDGQADSYQFPAAEIQAGEYITLHMRALEDGCIDETEADLNAATAGEALADARDFWVQNTSARIGDSDILLLYNDFTGKIIDCAAYSESEKTDWKNDAMRRAAEEAHAAGMWPSAAVSGALCSDGATPTRTISRQNIPEIAQRGGYDPAAMNGPGCWMVTATSTASPGKPNSDKPHIASK